MIDPTKGVRKRPLDVIDLSPVSLLPKIKLMHLIQFPVLTLISLSLYIYIYIYIYREREREREGDRQTDRVL